MSGYFCNECQQTAAGWCPSGQARHRQCSCCARCVREIDGERRSCGGNSPDVARKRLAHDHRTPRGAVNP